MEIDVWVVKCGAGSCGGPFLNGICNYLTDHKSIGFGSAIKTINAYARFPLTSRDFADNDFLSGSYGASQSKLPYIVFYRKRKTIELAFSTAFCSTYEDYASRKPGGPEQTALMAELILALLLLKKKIKKSDDFRFDDFERHLIRKMANFNRDSSAVPKSVKKRKPKPASSPVPVSRRRGR